MVDVLPLIPLRSPLVPTLLRGNQINLKPKT